MPSPWADQPYPLISTTSFSKNTSHAAFYVATQMSLAHNGIIRGLNSIYLQAPHIPSNKADTRDFLTYCQCWCESMHHHHDAEESGFFPELERIAGVPGLMAQNVEQHRAFTPGFEAFQAYVKGKEFSGEKVRELVGAFAEELVRHLHDEIETLKGMEKYDSEAVRKAYKRLEKVLMETDNYRIAPLVFGTADRNYEGGMHDFPSVPFFVPYVIHYVFGAKHRGVWRFNPCTAWRDRRELAFGGKETTA